MKFDIKTTGLTDMGVGHRLNIKSRMQDLIFYF